MYRLAALALLLAPVALSAPPAPTHVAKYRHTVMEAAGKHMGALSMLVKGETDRKQDALAHAEAISDIAKMAGSLFPDGTGPGPGIETDAKPEVWSEKEKFAEAMRRFETEAGKLVAAAGKDDFDAFKTQFVEVGATCGDCHDRYRVDEEKGKKH